MLPGYVAEHSLYRSRGIYMEAGGTASSGALDITPAFFEEFVGLIILRALVADFVYPVAGPVGGSLVDAGFLVGTYCLLFGCD